MAVHLAIRKGLDELKGKERLGLQAYADGMLVIPKTLAQNAGRFLYLPRFGCILDAFRSYGEGCVSSRDLTVSNLEF